MLGALLSIGGSIAGGIAGANAASKQRRMLQEQKQENQAWYDKNYYQDPTQRADAQAAISRMKDVMQQRTQRAAGTAAVTGATEETVAAEKAAQNNALAEVTSNIAANNEQRKDQIEQTYQAKNDAFTEAEMQQKTQIGQNVAAAVSGIGQVAGEISNGFAKVEDAKVEDANKVARSVTNNTVIPKDMPL